MKYAILLISLLLFEPIVIDQQIYDRIMQSSHQNMRGAEFDMLSQMLNSLEQQAVQNRIAEERQKNKINPPPAPPPPDTPAEKQ